MYGKTAKGHNEKAGKMVYIHALHDDVDHDVVPDVAMLLALDIWSYGMVLFELLTLDIPYRGSVKNHFQIPSTIEAGIRVSSFCCGVYIDDTCGRCFMLMILMHVSLCIIVVTANVA